MFDDEWFWALSAMWVLGARVYLQLAELLTTEASLWDHSSDRTEDRVSGVLLHCLAVGRLFDATRVTGCLLYTSPSPRDS